MRVYFTSCTPSALKLNGLYIGTIDNFERSIELSPADKIFAEIVPHNNMQPLNFVLDEEFFKAPPNFVDVYLLEGEALINIQNFVSKDTQLDIIFQRRFAGSLITVFSQGKIYLTIEGEEYTIKTLPDTFKDICGEVEKIGNYEVFALFSHSFLVVISSKGQVVFFNRVQQFEFGEMLKVVSQFETCTCAKAQCYYTYDNQKLTLCKSKTIEEYAPQNSILHFAFFESILTGGDYERYLSDELRQKAKHLKSFLGDYVGVSIPTEKFYTEHGDILAAGLIYPQSKNLFTVKYYAVTLTATHRIDNLYPISNL